MKLNGRSVLLWVLLFTAVAVAMLWGLNQRSQNEWRAEVFERAGLRSMQLADAMAGQVGAELALMDHTLLDVRETWLREPEAGQALAAQKLNFLPDGLVSHLSVVNAEGQVVYSSRNIDVGLDIKDRPHFAAVHSGSDHMVVGNPLQSSANGAWLIPVGRPLYRDGQFAGAIYLLISAERMGQRLGRLALDKKDIVVLLNFDGPVLARSVDNAAAMGQVAPKDRPFLQEGAAVSGTYRQNSLVDTVPRVFGWHRLAGNGILIVVGLAESSVLAPVVSSLNRSFWLTGLLSGVLLAGGLAVAWLLRREERTGQALRESARQLEDAQRMAKLGHWSLDLRTRDFIWSDEVYRIMGMQQGSDSSAYKDILKRVHPEDRAGFEEKFEQAIKSGVKMDVAHRVLLPDGGVKHVHALGIFELENGEPVRCQGTVQDITEVRSAQLALEAMNEELEARVAARTSELGALNNELEAFAYSVSHDLRTPLRSIHGFATLLEEEAETLSSEGRAHLRRIQDGARRMGLLITDLLTMAHQSRAVVHLQQVNLSELAQAVVVDIAREDPQRAVVWTIAPGMSAMADPVLMRVVLQNLLGNAWKYTSQTPQPKIVFERVGHTGGMVEFCVCDNGAGFDMAYVDQLFKPFKRLHAHHEFEGSGIGLASVQRLIQRHGGTVRAEGAVGQGAAFYFTVPLTSP
ncbi:ATP-binding protein [Hydrogenophaga sp. PAMC20947]|uniref:ATP-binding protein n=1 Tax=Hydrogenophaga sp. PAMC20947 TaxID=2565558 RepID=UPI0014470E28|nr:ATP-binding protein [Hydrogenophaga sp. PAMC20947]